MGEEKKKSSLDDEIDVRGTVLAFCKKLTAYAAPYIKKLAEQGRGLYATLSDQKKRAALMAAFNPPPAKKAPRKKVPRKIKAGDTQAADDLAMFLFQQEMLKHPLQPGALLAPLKVQKKQGGGGPDDLVFEYDFELRGTNTYDQVIIVSAHETVDDKYRTGTLVIKGDTMLGTSYGQDSEKLWPVLKAFHAAYLEDEKRNAKKQTDEETLNPLKLMGA